MILHNVNFRSAYIIIIFLGPVFSTSVKALDNIYVLVTRFFPVFTSSYNKHSALNQQLRPYVQFIFQSEVLQNMKRPGVGKLSILKTIESSNLWIFQNLNKKLTKINSKKV
ncbi:hypothetical protein WA026_006111 [Henosepilachna vigintioctopunctata]|uniref:Secreted protein n=1 Tax=Henosepilachna vigintioctopunctata TaxID=420089 RepID=A0AAW1TQF5_9CUCU